MIVAQDVVDREAGLCKIYVIHKESMENQCVKQENSTPPDPGVPHGPVLHISESGTEQRPERGGQDLVGEFRDRC